MGDEAAAVVIGASAGAIDALSTLLGALPRTFRLPVIIVVHLPADRPSLMAELFQNRCQIPVQEADDKEPLIAGRVYLAPPDYHLLVESEEMLSLSADELVHYSRPAIDVLFESAADVFGPRLIGIVLTGANRDGSIGLRTIGNAGGRMIVQNPELAASPEMPMAALALCPEAEVRSLEQIAEMLIGAGCPS